MSQERRIRNLSSYLIKNFLYAEIKYVDTDLLSDDITDLVSTYLKKPDQDINILVKQINFFLMGISVELFSSFKIGIIDKHSKQIEKKVRDFINKEKSPSLSL